MIYRILLIAALALPVLLSISVTQDNGNFVDINSVDQMSVADILKSLDQKLPSHYIEVLDPSKAKMGEDLIRYGTTTYDGKKSKRISAYFVCTDCHNLQREFSSMSDQNPQHRLDYAKEKGLPFLPGSSFFGIYNRSTFYNGDYVKKYGDLVLNARDTLANAVQVCAKYCSSGRLLDAWELEAIMHYYKQQELHVSDISLTDNDKKNLLNGQLLDAQEKQKFADKISKQLIGGYDATFLTTQTRGERKYGEGGNVENGKLIYDRSCLHCHLGKRVTYMHLDHDKLSANLFWRNRKNFSDKSLYQIVRYGTYSKKGRKQYMPLYTKEKLSDDQLNDLFAYIKQLAGK